MDVGESKYLRMTEDCIRSEIKSQPGVDEAVGLHSAKHAGALIGRGIAQIGRALTRQNTGRNAMLLSLLALPPVSFLYLALRPNPRQLWAQRWPTIVSSGLYQMALDRCVEITGLEYLPETGPVILAGNHINKTSMDGMLLGLKILVERGVPAKWVSIADPPGWMLQHFVRLLGKTEGVILPIQKGMTTKTMVEFLRNPSAFQRRQPILGIFPVGEADFNFEKHMTKPWHTSAAVAALETGAAIVPFFIEGLPFHWGPPDMLKAVARSLVGEPPFKFKIRLGPPLQAGGAKEDRNYKEIIERVHQTVRMLAS